MPTNPKPIHIRLLGGIQVEADGKALTGLGGSTYRSLLALLALKNGALTTREQIIEAIWPDAELDTGRNRLSTALVHLRKVLGNALLADRNHVSIEPSLVSVDVVEFNLAARTAPPGRACQAAEKQIFYARRLTESSKLRSRVAPLPSALLPRDKLPSASQGPWQEPGFRRKVGRPC